MKLAIVSVAFLALLQTVLGLAVSICRGKYQKMSGCPDDPAHPMFRIRTAFSNCAEWHPLLMALLLVLPMSGSPKWAIWLNPVTVTARYLLVCGLVTAPIVKPNIFRFSGAATTIACSFLMIFLIMQGFFWQ